MTASTDSRRKLQYRVGAGADAENVELGRYLRGLGFTKAQISSLKFREDGIMVNGKRARVTQRVHEGDLVELSVMDAQGASDKLVPFDRPPMILYEDNDVIAVWKGAGVPVHPSHGHYSDTLTNSLHACFRQRGESVRIRSIGRLDKDTAGIVVFAKNQAAAARLWEQKGQGIFWKEYLALCEGSFDEERCAQDGWRTVNLPIAQAPGELMKMCVAVDGKAAVTHYAPVNDASRLYSLCGFTGAASLNCQGKTPGELICRNVFGIDHIACPEEKSGGLMCRGVPCTLVRARIETGRTHQIRVHMASVGHPLVGDPLYGSGLTGTDGARLCAYRAAFQQPFSGQAVMVEHFGQASQLSPE